MLHSSTRDSEFPMTNSPIHLERISRAEALRRVFPEVLRKLESGVEPAVDEGVVADLVSLHWLRRDDGGWRATPAGEEVCRSLEGAHAGTQPN